MKHNILIDLDALLDTRISTLMKINEVDALKLLELGYCNRQTDDLSNLDVSITNDEYALAYSKRNVDTLKEARITNYIFELATMIHQLTDDMARGTTRIDDVCLIINYYPYEDLDESTLQAIVYAIEQHVTSAIEIRTTYMKPIETGLNNLKASNILTYITYDFKLWFETNFSVTAGRDSVISYPKFTLIAPMLMPRNGAFDDLDVESQRILQNKTPFDFMRLYWAPLFGIVWCPIEMMSLIDTTIIS